MSSLERRELLFKADLTEVRHTYYWPKKSAWGFHYAKHLCSAGAGTGVVVVGEKTKKKELN